MDINSSDCSIKLSNLRYTGNKTTSESTVSDLEADVSLLSTKRGSEQSQEQNDDENYKAYIEYEPKMREMYSSGNFNEEEFLKAVRDKKLTSKYWMWIIEFNNNSSVDNTIKTGGFIQFVCDNLSDKNKDKTMKFIIEQFNQEAEKEQNSNSYADTLCDCVVLDLKSSKENSGKFLSALAKYGNNEAIEALLKNYGSNYLFYYTEDCKSTKQTLFSDTNNSNIDVSVKRNLYKKFAQVASQKFKEGAQLTNEELALVLYNDIYTKKLGIFPTTGNDIEAHINLINDDNRLEVLKLYKEITNKSLIGSIKNEFTLNWDQRYRLIEKIYDYQTNLNEESKVDNEYWQGHTYQKVQQGDIMTITDKDTGEERIVDLEKLISDAEDIEVKALLKTIIQKLPAEVILDIDTEARFIFQEKNYLGENINLKGMQAYFRGAGMDAICLNGNMPDINTVVHETGHAIDEDAKNICITTQSEKLQETFKKEVKAYENAGHKLRKLNYDEQGNLLPDDGNGPSNTGELFAEAYSMCMLGTIDQCSWSGYFQESIKICMELLQQRRELSAKERSNKK